MKRVENLPRIFGCLVLLLAFSVVNAQAAEPDPDFDGLVEVPPGIELFTGEIIQLCPEPSIDDTAFCVREAGPDIFVILVPAAGGHFERLSDPLQVLRNLDRPTPVATTGVHELTPGQVSADRRISPTSMQKAIMIIEDLGVKGSTTNKRGVWGSARWQGTPNTPGGGVARVFTEQIAADIIGLYEGVALPAGKIDECIRHTIAHEAGHNVLIAAQPEPGLTGSHYSTSQAVVMSQAPLLIRDETTVRLADESLDVICPSPFADPDHTGFRLKP